MKSSPKKKPIMKAEDKKKLDEITKKVLNFEVAPTKPITNKSLRKAK